MYRSILTHSSRIAVLILTIMIASGCRQDVADAPPGFDIHPAFKLELVAAEPLVFDPIDMKFDETGRAFVLEMPGYPLRDEGSRLILLQDNDGDGIYDSRHVYADGLPIAASFMPYKGGMLVAAPPGLLFVKDTDNDDVIDETQVIMSGFSVGNLQHNYNGLTYGLDNWIYAANGGNSGNPHFKDDPANSLDLRGDDFRFRIEDELLERVGASSGGYELAFDNWGHMYETHNLEHVSQLVFEGRYTDGLPVSPAHALTVISDHEENGLSRIYPIGEQETRVNHPEQSGYFSGSCGITFYGGGVFPEGFNDNLFVADCVLNLVHLDVLSADKASLKASRMRDKVEFLASSDRAFRPVNMVTGPDGALYLIDMYRDVIEHPEWIPDEIEATLDLAAGKEKGRIYRITPKGKWPHKPTKLNAGDLNGLVQALESRNQWTRLTAQRLIVQSANDEGIPLLEELFENTENPLARLHCLWTLEGLGGLKDELLGKGLGDPAFGVRENAVKIAEIRLNSTPELIDRLLEMTSDPDARVRMQAALTLSTLEADNFDGNAESITLALSQMVSQTDVDIWTIMAVASAAQRKPVEFCQKLLTESVNESKVQVAQILGRLTGKNNNSEATAAILEILQENTDLSDDQKSDLIEAIAEGWASNQSGQADKASLGKVVKALEKLEERNTTSIVRSAGSLRKAMKLAVSGKIKNLIAKARVSVLNADLNIDERLRLLELISLDAFDKRENVLYQLLDNRQPIVLQKEVLTQLWDADKRTIGSELLKRWPDLGPEARKAAGNILLYKSYNHDLLLTALENGSINMGELNLDLERRRVLLWWTDDENVKKRAEALFSDAGVVQRKEAIENMRPALALAGDVARGTALFTSLCSQCHQYGDIGVDVGPVLTEINRKSKESLLYDILDPNAAVDTRYINHQIRTKDGNIYTGMIHRETDTDVSLRMMGGIETTINKKDIEKLSSLGISMMPEGQEANMSPQDMADLLAFLQQSPY